MTVSAIIIFLVMLFALVVVHELGHFGFAKFFKMKVEEFAFGFPPRLLQKKFGETVYSFNMIPLGGYVKIFGENGLSEEESQKLTDSDRKKLFGSHSALSRIIVLSGGVLFNILGAVIIFAIVFMMGSNVYLDKQEVRDIPYTDRRMLLVDMNDNSALKNTGIQIGDRIVKMSANGEVLENETLTSFAASDFIQAHNNAQILITFVDKNGNTSEISAVPKAGIVEGKKLLGAKFSDSTFKKYSFFEAIPQAVKTTYEQLIFIFTSLWGLLNDMLFHNAKVEDNLSGPVGLAIMTSQVSTQGLDQILIFAAMLSLSLAAFNILPIPALDGGRIVFVLAEIVKGKKIRPSTEQMFHGLGFLALLGLMVFITYFDIVKALALNS